MTRFKLYDFSGWSEVAEVEIVDESGDRAHTFGQKILAAIPRPPLIVWNGRHFVMDECSGQHMEVMPLIAHSVHKESK